MTQRYGPKVRKSKVYYNTTIYLYSCFDKVSLVKINIKISQNYLDT